MTPLTRGSSIARFCGVVSLALTLGVPGSAAAQRVSDGGRFRHEIHAGYECVECHSTGRATTAANSSWCADCHHVNVGYEQCQRCHSAEEISPEPLRRLATFHLPDAERTRSLTFDHTIHQGLSCSNCHTGGAALKVEASCASCHSDHHKAGSTCTACHAEPPIGAHNEEVHQNLPGCGAAGCHSAPGIDYASMIDERNFCIACHVGQKEHEQPNPCVECHKLGQPESVEPRP